MKSTTYENPFSTASFSPQQNKGSFVHKDFRFSLFTLKECRIQKDAKLVLLTFTYNLGQPPQVNHSYMISYKYAF